ncbi:WD40/YVTN/BNR-like repeat-containing protein [Mucilaginibacter achroorhodeus]|uniref:WD40/YVTN/BNR-like repeat-containing protein n=1 Tax=Mucilaginibacter achroorhodeus TaxID=2599294 RepID=UPI0021BD6B27|nr:YCF48-related protein [Mucilaginibacter achroorhodeus]
MHKFIITIICAFFISVFSSQAQTIINLQSGKKTSIRGLSVVNDKVAWISGSGGTVGITNDGGSNWSWLQVKGYEKSDFRDIEAFSDKEAVIVSSGTPAYILKTADGGLTWTKHFEQRDTSYFLDAMDFKDPKHGFVLGDPINGKFLLLKTDDGGNNWVPAHYSPGAYKNEAAFAASGTCIRVYKSGIMIVSGGSKSRLISSTDNGKNWHYLDLPLTDGTSSRGAFSVAKNGNEIIIVGGNYAKDKLRDSVAVIINGSENISKASMPTLAPEGFQSSVEHLNGNFYLSTGTSGTNISTDSGNTWKKIDDRSYNVCRKAKKGKLVLLAGDKGNIGILKF